MKLYLNKKSSLNMSFKRCDLALLSGTWYFKCFNFLLSSHATFNLQYQQTSLFPYHIYQATLWSVVWFVWPLDFIVCYILSVISHRNYGCHSSQQNMSNWSKMMKEIEMCQLVFFFLERFCWQTTVKTICEIWHLMFLTTIFRFNFIN